ncbi:hypothetical protein [Acidiphilium sp. PA]|uniref:hypothetical protein n=1 Tax=Acidiphilium sp. PA TaxID=2871705 RepID=UPI002243037E|nr:hypothetical protein [Acidiphilium sp. PA]
MSGSQVPTGSSADMLGRLKAVLPVRWFGDATPVLDAVLGGIAAAWSTLYSLIGFAALQTRIATANGPFLDIAAQDYFGTALTRRAGETDAAFGARIRSNLLAPRATRDALITALVVETGRVPVVFEPFNTGDTGGYSSNTLGYNTRGGYGSVILPYQCFVTAYRPVVTASGNNGGYNYGPGGYATAPMAWSDLVDDPGLITDAEIYAAIVGVLPANGVAWTRLSD